MTSLAASREFVETKGSRGPMANWATSTLKCLKAHNVRVVTYVPDKILIPLIEGVKNDDQFTEFIASREEEAIGIAGGVALGGSRGIVMMQSSGFGNISNALASFAMPYQLPVVMFISERGAIGEFNSVQVAISRTIRPTLDVLGIPHATLSRDDETEFIVDRMLYQAYETQSPVALIISTVLNRDTDSG